MADASLVRGQNDLRVTALAAVAAGEVWQMKDGRAAVNPSSSGSSSGDRVSFRTSDQWTFPKSTGFVGLDGGRAYWDYSANAVSFRKVNDRDFYLGRFVGDSASIDTTCVVNINVDPAYDLDAKGGSFFSTLLGTAAAGGLSYPIALGGTSILELTATNEAQKVDLLSVDGFALTANAIIEGAFRVLSDGSGTVVDVSLGVANGTNATDADAIAEHCFIHLDANNTNINAQSKDGTTTVAATDTTTDYTEGGAVANRVEFWMDLRDPADVQIYVNGVNVLPSTVFNVNAAAGPWFLLAHVEKTASTDTYKLALDWLRVRYSEQDAS